MVKDSTRMVRPRMVYTVPEAAALLRVNEATVYRQVRSGMLQAVRIGDRILITRQTLEQVLGMKLGE